MSKVRLYIAGNEVDFGEGDNLLLFTYSAADLDAPAVVQNSYSKEITLPPTKRNAAVFGALWRPDKVASGADGFDALAREPFEIRNHAGELLESGYVKLSSASARDGFTLVLYGGLGAFLYGLMYNSDGSKKTLADLSWGDTLDAGLSFNITKDIVQAAWTRLQNTSDPMPLASPYDIINFAPMHNGLPSDFDANKGLVPTGTAHGCHTYGGQTGVTIDGTDYALVTFGKQFDEWEVRDLRSYLQRPVFRIKALLSALEDSNQNGGYTFDWSTVASLLDLRAWMTLPMLHTEEVTEGQTTLTLSWSPSYGSVHYLRAGHIYAATPAQTIPSVGKLSLSVGVRIKFATSTIATTEQVVLSRYASRLYVFLRLIGYDSANNPIAYGPVREICGDYDWQGGPSKDARNAVYHLSSKTGTTPEGYVVSSKFGVINPSAIEYQVKADNLEADGTNARWLDTAGLTLEGYNIDHFGMAVEAVLGVPDYSSWSTVIVYGGMPRLISGSDTAVDINSFTWTNPYASAAVENSAKVRTGAYISKRALLGGTASPAEILLSLTKMFGFVLAYDGINKRVRLLNRGDFYAGDELDISERIDRSQPFVVEPNTIKEKWLRFALGNPEGKFAEYYRNKYGVEYGEMRADTGSPFNAETLNVLDGIKFVEGVTGLAYSRYFYKLKDSSIGSGVLPSPYLDNDCTYVLWDADGKAIEHNIVNIKPTTVSLTPICDIDISSPNGYDGDFRTLLAGDDNAQAKDGAGILLWCDATIHEYCHLTDDSAGMLNQNNGQPCWIPCLSDTEDLIVPSFISVSLTHNWGDVSRALNIARPQELAGWDYYYREGVDVYSRRWRAYIADRYNENAHRVTCYVDWGGIRVEQALLGKFFWFDGCWWVLDKIEDYCWDNPQPCKCTFVRVLDKTAYTNGQS